MLFKGTGSSNKWNRISLNQILVELCYNNRCIWRSRYSYYHVIFWCIFYKSKHEQAILFPPPDVSEDPFTSHQDESSEGLTSNFMVENFLQTTKDLSFTPQNNPNGGFSRSTRSFITDEILEALRKADRKGRDVVVGLSNACCKWGCSKSEISSLCWGLMNECMC